MRVLFVAAENGALPGGKVGGVGDVVRDLPAALAARGCRVTVVTPSHGYLHLGPGAGRIGSCGFLFRGHPHTAEIYRVLTPETPPEVSHLVVHHPAVTVFDASAGKYRIYSHDPADRPFFTDASRFAFFCGATAAAVSNGLFGPLDIIHLHDWHTALVLMLGRFHPDFSAIRNLRSIFSIHNLAFQGVRPLRGSESSLEAWFPELRYDWTTVADPRWPDCLNPMALGIRIADRIHTVSPSYADEIRQPSRKPQFYGGEGLEADLERAHRSGRLIGILNGCRYDRKKVQKRIHFGELFDLIRRETIRWSGSVESTPSAHFIAFARSLELERRADPPEPLITVVGRAGEQKMLLMRRSGKNGKPGLDSILEGIGSRGCLVLLGTGDRTYETFLTATSARRENFIFLNGFSEKCARALYAAGDLFLMPSSFEPCGLGQMLAMREGQPCVVHAVGGLKDTVRDGHNGFSFNGATLEEQVDRFVGATLEAIALRRENPAAWEKILQNAAAVRFTWEETAERYLNQLYSGQP